MNNIEQRFQDTETLNYFTQKLIYNKFYKDIMDIKSSLGDENQKSKLIINLCNTFLYFLEPERYEFTKFFESTNAKFEEYEKYFDSTGFGKQDQLFSKLDNINISACQIIIEEVEFYKTQLPLIESKEAEDETKLLDKIDIWNIEQMMSVI